MYSDVFSNKYLASSSLAGGFIAGGNAAADRVRFVGQLFDSYLELELPYLDKKPKIENNTFDGDDVARMKDFLQQARANKEKAQT